MDENQAFGLEFSLPLATAVVMPAIRKTTAEDLGPDYEISNPSNDLSDSINNQNYTWTSNQITISKTHKKIPETK